MTLLDNFNFLLLVAIKWGGVEADKSETTESSSVTVTTSPVEENWSTEHHGKGFIVGLLNKERDWMYTGSLITWTKVLTTCTAIHSKEVEYVCFRFDDQICGWHKKIRKFETDERCENRSISSYLRYNVGVIHVGEPAQANDVIRLLQYPSLSKQKYLRHTDQMGWREIKMQIMPSNELAHCHRLTGLHEFMCAESEEIPIETIKLNQGTPVLCGEDAYGILVAPENLDLHEKLVTTKTLVLMRLDEFVHVIIKPDPNFDEYS